ncbi:unnamed protein product [Ophioblennius macclurei]
MENYCPVRVIGEGSFGRAVLVRCKQRHEEFVMKEIQLPKNRPKLESSRREAVLLSTMKHPHIVAFRESFEADDLLCIVMEYCGGGDLLRRIQRQKNTQFCVDNILKWFAQMCAGAKYIHDQRVLHRDLKSKNIFLTDDGTIKLGDFGSACVLNSSKAHARAYVGTPYYVAPEIWDNRPYNNKSDVWSLGCVLYELCTLHHPFQAPSWKSLILKVCRGAYPPLPSRLPYELHHLVKQMFKTDPRDRPSLHTILTSHRVSRLLRTHLPPQVEEAAGRARRTKRWNREEGEKVLGILGDKSLMKTETSAGGEFPQSAIEGGEPRPRKQWPAEPSDSILEKLANRSLLSDSVSSTTSDADATRASEEPEHGRRRRKQWDRDRPERLLSLLDKARLSRGFSTFLIKRGEDEDDPLVGPLSPPPPQGDDIDGPEQEVTVDESRLEPRSDDDDTDFEEDSPCDWMDEAEKMFSQH